MRGYIYCIQNKINGKCYIGQTARSVKERFKAHCDHSVSGKLKIQRAIRKYGKENFEVITLMYLDSNTEIGLRAKLNYVEKYFVCRFNTKKGGYNMTDGGDGNIGYEWKEDQRLGQAKRCKEQWQNDDGRLKRGLEKAQEKSHEAHKRKVVQFDLNGNFVAVFDSVTEAIRGAGVKSANISACCKRKPKHDTAGGFIWRYADEFKNGIPLKIEAPDPFNWKEHYDKIREKLKVKIHAYKNGKLFKEFDSIKEAYLYFDVTRMVLKRYINRGITIGGCLLKRIELK